MILLTGASGYVGGRLLERIESAQLPVRCLSRNPQFLQPRVRKGTEVVSGDVLDLDSLRSALKGVRSAYYLVHSMGGRKDFKEIDRQGALNFARAAKENQVDRIIYLGGLGQETEDLSDHLKSRQDVGRWLHQYGVPVIELRASIIIGAGSLSFELIRNLVDKLPVMITPKWVQMEAQPIAIDDVLDYLQQSLEISNTDGHTIYEIGGPERLSYQDLMSLYAEKRKLKRVMIPVPVLTPWLSSLWLGLITPVYARIGRKLVESIRHSTVVNRPPPPGVFSVSPTPANTAFQRAIDQEYPNSKGHWASGLASAGSVKSWQSIPQHRRLTDTRTCLVRASMEEAFKPIEALGGETGWYAFNFLWNIRGWLDLLAGGVGMRRGRRHPEELLPGDYVDFWRVQKIDRPQHLRLVAEMQLPGNAWLEFHLENQGTSQTLIRQKAVFETQNIFGYLYWYLSYPLHFFVFNGLLKGIARKAHTHGKVRS